MALGMTCTPGKRDRAADTMRRRLDRRHASVTGCRRPADRPQGASRGLGDGEGCRPGVHRPGIGYVLCDGVPGSGRYVRTATVLPPGSGRVRARPIAALRHVGEGREGYAEPAARIEVFAE